MKYRYRNEDELKDSGIEWLGKVPKDYKIMRSKYLWKKEKREIQDNYGVITAFRDGEVTLRTNRRVDGFTFSIKEVGYQGVLKGDLVISAMDAFAGAIGISDSEGKCSPVYSVCSPIKELIPYYYKYLLKEMSQKGYILSLAKGIRERSTDFRYGEFANTFLLYPNLTEQEKIAKFLDEKTSQFDTIIAKKEKLIEKLEEAKKSLISEVVTGKVKVVKTQAGYKLEERKKEEMKDSVGNVLKEIPNTWILKKLKYNCYLKGRIGWQGLKQSEFIDKGPYLITGMNFKNGKINWNEVYHISEERYNEAPDIHLKVGDVLITKDGTIGKLLFIDSLPDKASLNSHLLVMRPLNKDFIPKFLYYSLDSSYFKDYVEKVKTGTTFFGITQEAISNFNLLIPSINEQTDIVNVLDERLDDLDSLIVKTKKEIKLLKLGKQSLISEAVTGKIEILD